MPGYRFRSEKYVSRGFKDLAVSLYRSMPIEHKHKYGKGEILKWDPDQANKWIYDNLYLNFTPIENRLDYNSFQRDIEELKAYASFRGPKEDSDLYYSSVLEVCKSLVDEGIKNRNQLNKVFKTLTRSEVPNKIRREVD